MRLFRGFIYKLITSGPVARVVGRVFKKAPFDRNGPVVLPSSADYQLVSSVIFNVYEYPERVLIKKYLPPDIPCIELGSSLGIISREILRKLNRESRLFSVEAMPGLVDLAHININHAANATRYMLKQAAIDYNGPTVTFSSGATNLDGRISNMRSNDDISIPAITLSKIIEEFVNGYYSLVLDIEGAEYQIIEHDMNSLRNCQCIVAELHGSSAERDDFCRKVSKAGMKLVERKHSVYAFRRHSALSVDGSGPVTASD